MLGYYASLQHPFDTLWVADFSTLTPGAVSLASYDLALLRASDGFTVQSSEQAVITGLTGNNVARAGRRQAADPVALLVERNTTNLCQQSQTLTNAFWTPNSGATRADVASSAPDGGTSQRVTTSAATDTGSRCMAGGSGFTNQTVASMWYLRGTQGGTGSMRFSVSTGFTSAPANANWRRVVSAYNASDASAFFAWYNGATGATSPFGAIGDNALVWGCQAENASNGHYATEYVPTTTASVARAAEQLRKTTGSALLTGGQFRYYGRVQPKGARADYVTSIPLWFVDASNNASVAPATGVVTVVVGGTSVASTSNPMTWAAFDDLEFFVVAGSGVPSIKWRVNGGATTTTGTPATPQGALAFGGTVDLLCQGTTTTFTAWTRKLAAYTAGNKPSWA